MRTGRRMVLVALTAVSVTTVGCGAGDSADRRAEGIADSTSPPSSTAPAGTSTTAAISTSETSAAREGSGLADPTTIPTVLVDEAARAWVEPELLGSIESLSMGVAVPGGRTLLHFERTGETFEGCEGGIGTAHRLVITDFDTGQHQVLIPDLSRNDWRVELGTENRFAIVSGCDANAWLGAVGTLSSDGSVEFNRLPDAPEERLVRGGGNAGVSMTWSSDGEILYFDTTLVDAITGEPVALSDPDAPLWLHAQLADGSKLVSHWERADPDPGRAFWLLDPDAPMDVVPDRPPLFRGQATYPVVDVELSRDGRSVAVVLDRWTSDVRTLLVEVGGVTEMSGFATLTSDWSRALVESSGAPGAPVAWTVVDVASGSAIGVPIESVPGNVQEVVWAGDETGLLVSATEGEVRHDTPLQIWYLEPIR